MIEGDNMNFVPKERAESSINRILEERQERKRKEREQLEKEYKNSKK